MKIPEWDPKEIREITEAEKRLRKEAELLGYWDKLRNERYEAIKASLEKNAGIFDVIGVVFAKHMEFQVETTIQLAVLKRVLEVLLAHLGEAGHAEAVRALRQLRIQDIIDS